jgi:hypothetical protein
MAPETTQAIFGGAIVFLAAVAGLGLGYLLSRNARY